MSGLSIKLKTPHSGEYEQPTGLYVTPTSRPHLIAEVYAAQSRLSPCTLASR
jgi:hypothetical protein